MKKLLLTFFKILSIIIISSCSKTDKSLVGTTWVCHDGSETYELCFYSQQDVELSMSSYGDIESLYGTYEYNPPYIFFKFPNPESTNGGTFEGSGKIKGNTIEWTGGMIFSRI